MKPIAPFFVVLALTLLLLQLPMLGYLGPDVVDASAATSAMDMSGDGHDCHGDDGQGMSCQEPGCALCGLLSLPDFPAVSSWFARQLFVFRSADPALPRFEQSVELHPPQTSFSA